MSAPYERLLAMNGITVENIVAQAKSLLLTVSRNKNEKKNERRTTMKKFLALALALVMVFALAACGGESGNEGEGGTPSGESVELTLTCNGTDLGNDTRSAKRFKELIEAETDGRITVKNHQQRPARGRKHDQRHRAAHARRHGYRHPLHLHHLQHRPRGHGLHHALAVRPITRRPRTPSSAPAAST